MLLLRKVNIEKRLKGRFACVLELTSTMDTITESDFVETTGNSDEDHMCGRLGKTMRKTIEQNECRLLATIAPLGDQAVVTVVEER